MGDWFAGFESLEVDVGDGVTLRGRVGGNPAGPPLLLLHGYPQTHAMWHRVAERLAPEFRLVLPDLPAMATRAGPRRHRPPRRSTPR